MASFLEDVRAQAEVVHRLVMAYRGELAPTVDKVARILEADGERPTLVVGMGSSLSAGRVLPALFSDRSRLVDVQDAGEVLHYGLGGATAAGAVLALSQSGRSMETVRVVEELADRVAVPGHACQVQVGRPPQRVRARRRRLGLVRHRPGPGAAGRGPEFRRRR